MTRFRILTILSSLTAVLSAVAAGFGLFMQGGSGPYKFTTLHGHEVEMYGLGLYAKDAAFKAPIFRGTDAVMLFILVPALIFAIFQYRRGTMRGKVLLTALLSFFLYNAVSVSLGAAYNNLILVYIGYFSASLFAFILAFTSINLDDLAACIKPHLPARGIAIFMFIAGLSVMIWLNDIIGAMLKGGAPETLGPYTTEITYVIDLGVIIPLAYLTGVLLLRRQALGYLLAAILLVSNASIGLVVIMQTVMQTLAGIVLSVGQYIGYVGTFVVMGFFAIGLIARLFANLADEPPARNASPRKPALAGTRRK